MTCIVWLSNHLLIRNQIRWRWHVDLILLLNRVVIAFFGIFVAIQESKLFAMQNSLAPPLSSRKNESKPPFPPGRYQEIAELLYFFAASAFFASAAWGQ